MKTDDYLDKYLKKEEELEEGRIGDAFGRLIKNIKYAQLYDVIEQGLEKMYTKYRGKWSDQEFAQMIRRVKNKTK